MESQSTLAVDQFRVIGNDGASLGQFADLSAALETFNSSDQAAAVSLGDYVVARRRADEPQPLNLKAMPTAWAKLLGIDPQSVYRGRGVPTWLTRPHLVASINRARELQELVGEQFVVEYLPDIMLEDDTAAFGHLFTATIAPAQFDSLTDATLDDREPDLAGQLQEWLLRSAAAFQAAAERIAASRAPPPDRTDDHCNTCDSNFEGLHCPSCGRLKQCPTPNPVANHLLVVTRRPQESIEIGGDVKVTVQRVKGQQVRIGIEAPQATPIRRSELPTPRSAAV